MEKDKGKKLIDKRPISKKPITLGIDMSTILKDRYKPTSTMHDSECDDEIGDDELDCCIRKYN